MVISVVYKPPKGKIDKLISFLQQILDKRENKSKDFWILRDFNINYLKRDCPHVISFNSFLKKAGLKQLIDEITHPNKKGGSCIDFIITNSCYISRSGITDDFLTDHHTVYCIRKKAREYHDKEFKTVRNYSRYNYDSFMNLLQYHDWDLFDSLIDPNLQWEILLNVVTNILSIMCPYKRVFARKIITPWLSPEIYGAIRDKKFITKQYKLNRRPDDLK